MIRQFSTVMVAAMLMTATAAHASINLGDRPNLNMRTLGNQPITSKTLEGKLTIIEFWATWCGPCIAQLPHLKKLHHTYKDQGVVLVSVSIDKSAAVAHRFAQQNGMVWPQVHDPSQQTRLSSAWNVRGIPHAFLFSPDGELLWRGHPASIDAPLARALKSHPPRLQNGNADDGANAEAIEQAVESLRAAREAVDAGDLPGMLRHLAEAPAEMLSDRRVVGHGRVLLLKLKQPEVDAAALKAAREADTEGAAGLDALIAAVAPRAAELGAGVLTGGDADGTAQSEQAARLIENRLQQAEQAHEREQYHRAYRLYEWLLDRAGDTPAGATAAARIAAYEADQDIMTTLRAAQAEDEARSILAMADSYEKSGKPELAQSLYRRLLKEFSTTDCAAQAKARLAANE